MLKLIAGLVAAAWALAGWRNMPRLSETSSAAAGVSIAGCVLFAYWLGTRTKRASLMATAVASAEATALASVTNSGNSTAAVNLYIGGEDLGRHRAGFAASTGLDSAPWLQGGQLRPELDDTDALQTAMDDIGELELDVDG